LLAYLLFKVVHLKKTKKLLLLLTPMSSKMSMPFFSSAEKNLRFLMKTLQDFSIQWTSMRSKRFKVQMRVSVQL